LKAIAAEVDPGATGAIAPSDLDREFKLNFGDRRDRDGRWKVKTSKAFPIQFRGVGGELAIRLVRGRSVASSLFQRP
jgi:hypothetical protein